MKNIPIFKSNEPIPCERVIDVDQVYNSGQLVKCIFNGQLVYMTEKDCKALRCKSRGLGIKPFGI